MVSLHRIKNLSSSFLIAFWLKSSQLVQFVTSILSFKCWENVKWGFYWACSSRLTQQLLLISHQSCFTEGLFQPWLLAWVRSSFTEVGLISAVFSFPQVSVVAHSPSRHKNLPSLALTVAAVFHLAQRHLETDCRLLNAVNSVSMETEWFMPGLNIWSLSLGKSCCLRSREVLSCHSQRLVIITGSWTCFKITGLFYVCWIQSLFPRVITVVLSWQFCGTACIWNWRGICA